jgi:hypothetical protein
VARCARRQMREAFQRYLIAVVHKLRDRFF